MCGLPFSLRQPKATLLAAPVPSLPDYAGRSVYWSYIAVKADSPCRKLEDTFGSIPASLRTLSAYWIPGSLTLDGR